MIIYRFIDVHVNQLSILWTQVVDVPEVIGSAECLSVSYEARSHFVKELATFGALQTRRVPLEIRSNAQDVLIKND